MTVVNPKSISGINSITTGSGSDNLLTIHTSDASSTERVRINSSGDVIVGSGITVSPDGDIFATGVCTATTFSGSGASLTNLPAANITGTLPAISGANLTNLDASDLASGTVPTARLGSGTASSSTFLRGDSTFAAVTSTTINSNTNNYVITGTGTANELQGESGLTYDGDNLNLSAGAHDSGMTITAANNNQETKLNIKGKASDGTVHTVSITAKRSANRGDIEVGGSARLTMTSDGKVGVNQTAPTSELQVGGGTNPMSAKPTLHVAPSSGNATMSLRGGSPSIYFDGTSGGNAKFLTDGTDLTISNGNLDSAGSEKFRFRSDGGLCFNGDTAADNALDDYEEGTWTPTMSQGSATMQGATYTKVGRLVHVSVYANSFTNNTSSAIIQFNGLPFTSSSSQYSLNHMLLAYITTLNQSVAYIGGSQSSIKLYHYDSGGDYTSLNYSAIPDSGSNRRIFVSMTYMAA